jgi:hypothetical protein
MLAKLRKADRDDHDFAQAQTAWAIAKHESAAKKLLFPLCFKTLTKIIDGAREFF